MRHSRLIEYIALALLFWVILPASAQAGTIHIEWDAVPYATGYRVYYGESPGAYTHTMTVGPQPQATLGNLADCTTWFVAVKTLRQTEESVGFSNEISGWARPEISAIEPSVSEQGDQFTLDVHGANFKPGGRLSLDPDSVPADVHGDALVRIDSTSVLSCSHLQASVTVEPTARGVRAMEVGSFAFDFVVRNPDAVFGLRRSGFEIRFDRLRWDINRDDPDSEDRIDGADLSWLSYSYGSREGEAFYDPDADLNGDGIVDGEDLAFLASGFGLCWSGSAWSAEAC